jgi:septum formation protein
MDKAGAYGIQGMASRFSERIEGDYFNIVGLPIPRVYRMLKGKSNF